MLIRACSPDVCSPDLDDNITTGSGVDTIGGEVASSGSAAATNRAGTTAGTGAAHAGNDTIDAGDGTNWVSGGAFGNADATMTNEADVSGYGGEAYAGNDEIRTGTGHDIIAGEAFTFLSGNATANSSATATAGEEGFGLAMAGNDLLVADKGDTAALFGNDSVAGEALLGFAGTATANNAATATQGDAGIALPLTGHDAITLGYGDNVAAGEAPALGNNGPALPTPEPTPTPHRTPGPPEDRRLGQ